MVAAEVGFINGQRAAQQRLRFGVAIGGLKQVR